jgi:UDP-3-O-[3-hydroxymyristoyl] glucosamine N-acyltransferase
MDIKMPISVKEAAELLGLPFKGDGNLKITGINEIHKVRKGDLTFVDVPKYYKKALTSEASFIIINQDTDFPEGKAILISEDPFHDYNRFITHFMPEEKPHHVSFSKGENVSIGKDVQIYPGVVLGRDITIGDGCVLYPNVVIYDNAILGKNVIIHANTVIGGHAYYYKNRKSHFEKMISCGKVILEEGVEIGASCTIDKGVSGDTIIGAHTKLDNQVHVGHGVVIGKMCLIGAQVGIGGKTTIEDEVVLWGQTGVTKDITIGKGAVVSAQSGVSKSLEGGKAYFGSPAQEIRKAHKEMAWLRMHANEE